MNIPVVVLAAGASSRLGIPKQLVLIEREQNLLERAMDTAITANCGPVVVVVGAHYDKIAPVVRKYRLPVVENQLWKSGIGSSIRQGMLYVERHFRLAPAVIFMVCDQPFLNSDILSNLVSKWQGTSNTIIACRYAHTLGVPALFSREIFEDLLRLDNETGAKKLFAAYAGKVTSVDFPEGAYDVDTFGDLEVVRSMISEKALRGD